ncbi:hypothetical protein IE81DRAFT_346319 [Ceraceosorus guamensis]|uniref:LSM2-LSM8 complex subunit LSM8 n=1 Tax=Ceraceosorus guamensis TaxID=1522189 RepID=A0A316W219_9BASI|nr:hypothetical protein IE81DRAFT_346319 [Ceraceosorus guamensis]PWN43719.1 hypothetical protein IE81DRAFT_346319 [Ceraceosorus guamensis]
MANQAIVGYLQQQVLTLTQDGRIIIGTLQGFDVHGSIILSGSVERIYSMDAGVEVVPLGLYVMKGDAVSVIAEFDAEKDKASDLSEIRAEPILPVRHY